MTQNLENKSGIELGVLPTHRKFVGGVAPGDGGKLPRTAEGELVMIEELKALVAQSSVKINSTGISYFPGTDDDDVAELMAGIEALDLEPQTVLMVGGANPWDPADEDAVVEQLVSGLHTAKKYGVKTVASTSFEEWMSGRPTLEGADYENAVTQLAKVHHRAYTEAEVAGSSITCWNLEFLRTGEFTTFTSIAKAAPVATATNALLGSTVMQLMVDAAHCGDSGLTLAENEALIAELAERNEFGIFHASAKTTRGCLSTDDGWIPALMTAAAKTGKLKDVHVEVFHHEDEALQALRDLVPGHGVDTTDGRTYTQVVIDGIIDVTHRLNNLKARGIL